MITLVGIGHVFSIRDAVRHIIFSRRPNAVCLELDKLRFEILERGDLGKEDGQLLSKILHGIYEKAASAQGATVGEEMLGAADAARDLGVPYFLIDVEATPMVNGLLKDMNFVQKAKLLGSVLGAYVVPKKLLEKEIRKIEEDPTEAMEQFERVFPELKRRLVDYRDHYMADRIVQISIMYPHTLAVVGEGHIKGIRGLLEGQDLEVIHLKDVTSIARRIENGELPFPRLSDPTGNCNWAMSFEIDQCSHKE
ncbi:MAG: TraB/GumN family protein [Candidatus Thermoplasmatota archaeon]|nr:TraB/GumN family protein [Candidatus Thermoplasmatota archaeon]